MGKLISRKLGVTIGRSSRVVLEIDDPVRAGVAGAVAIATCSRKRGSTRPRSSAVVNAAEEGVDKAQELVVRLHLPHAVLAAAVITTAALASCAELKPVARTTHDVAKQLCELFYSEKNGITVEEAGRAFCATERTSVPGSTKC